MPSTSLGVVSHESAINLSENSLYINSCFSFDFNCFLVWIYPTWSSLTGFCFVFVCFFCVFFSFVLCVLMCSIKVR